MLMTFFYILLSVGAVCAILSFIYILQIGSLMVRLNNRLGELVDILFILGNKNARSRRDTSIENLPGHGRGLMEVPNENQVTYDERITRPIAPERVQKGTPIGPQGFISPTGNWENNF